MCVLLNTCAFAMRMMTVVLKTYSVRRCCTATCTKQSYQRRDAEEKGKQKSQRTGQTQEEEAAVLGADVHVSKAVRLCKNGPDREHICSGTCQVAISFSFAVVLALPVFLTMNTVWGPSFSHMICALL